MAGMEWIVLMAVAAVAALVFALSRLGAAKRGQAVKESTAAELGQGLEAEKGLRIKFETLLGSAQETIMDLKAQQAATGVELRAALIDKQDAEKQVALAKQSVEEMKIRLADRDKTRTEFMIHAKAAVLTTSQEVSSKLINDHKRENEAAKKQAEEHTNKTTENLVQNFDQVTKSVASLNDQVRETSKTVDTVWQALSSPGGAGYYAEIGLENTLKNMGLERDRDFRLEFSINDSVEGKKLRPDAVVFLPGDSVLVIDSKASKFLLELANVEKSEDEEQAYSNLARTMNRHLRALATKDYEGAIRDSYKKSGHENKIRRTINVMYLPNEGAFEKLRIADPKFDEKAAKARIIVAGPSSLTSIIGFASVDIDLGRQAENQEQIVVAAQQLLESVETVVGHVGMVGKGLKSAVRHYMNLTGAINSRILPRASKLESLGVRPGKNKSLPKHLSTYQIIDTTDPTVIDGEAEEVVSATLTDQSEAAE